MKNFYSSYKWTKPDLKDLCLRKKNGPGKLIENKPRRSFAWRWNSTDLRSGHFHNSVEKLEWTYFTKDTTCGIIQETGFFFQYLLYISFHTFFVHILCQGCLLETNCILNALLQGKMIKVNKSGRFIA